MKVFVPIPDSALEVNDGVYRSLIPFDPAFLAGNRAREGRKPSNWISGSDYESQTGHCTLVEPGRAWSQAPSN